MTNTTNMTCQLHIELQSNNADNMFVKDHNHYQTIHQQIPS